jgi:hypothetical protein
MGSRVFAGEIAVAGIERLERRTISIQNESFGPEPVEFHFGWGLGQPRIRSRGFPDAPQDFFSDLLEGGAGQESNPAMKFSGGGTVEGQSPP